MSRVIVNGLTREHTTPLQGLLHHPLLFPAGAAKLHDTMTSRNVEGGARHKAPRADASESKKEQRPFKVTSPPSVLLGLVTCERVAFTSLSDWLIVLVSALCRKTAQATVTHHLPSYILAAPPDASYV